MDFSAHAETGTDYQVWTVTADGRPAYVYRDNLGALSIAQNWAKSWNTHHPADVPEGVTFAAVAATSTTTYQEV